jgi:hypothetical protein
MHFNNCSKSLKTHNFAVTLVTGPVKTPGAGFPFCRLQPLPGSMVEVLEPVSIMLSVVGKNSQKAAELLFQNFNGRIEKTYKISTYRTST